MKKNKREIYTDPWDRDFYETGSTRPPKEHGGVIAVLLVMVILLGSACSALGILNLHLLQQLAQQDPDADTMHVFESAADDPAPSPIGENPDSISIPRLGVSGETVSDFDRRFYDLPQGFLITDVTEDACAHTAGIHTGDVIYRLNGRDILSREALEEALAEFAPGSTLSVEFFRPQTGRQLHAELTLDDE